jgi:hypothetical protein
VGYRFRVTNRDGRYLVEQQAYLEPDGDQIKWIRVMCAGYQLVDETRVDPRTIPRHPAPSRAMSSGSSSALTGLPVDV